MSLYNIIMTFWKDNISILYDYEYMMDFFPTKTQTKDEQLNAIMRLSIYITILLFLYKGY